VLPIAARAGSTLTSSLFVEDVKDFYDSLATVISQRLACSDNVMHLKYGMGTKSVTKMVKKKMKASLSFVYRVAVNSEGTSAH
jgi:hypothetical protein